MIEKPQPNNPDAPRVIATVVEEQRYRLDCVCPRCKTEIKTHDRQLIMLWDKTECPVECPKCSRHFYAVRQRILTDTTLSPGATIDPGLKAVKRARAKLPNKVNGS